MIYLFFLVHCACQSCSAALLFLLADICLMTGGVLCDFCPVAAVGTFPHYQNSLLRHHKHHVSHTHLYTLLNFFLGGEGTGLLLVVFCRLQFRKKLRSSGDFKQFLI